MPSFRQQWRALSVHDRYAVAMLVVLFVIPGIALVGFLVAVALTIWGAM